jgi:hypothetical protein
MKSVDEVFELIQLLPKTKEKNSKCVLVIDEFISALSQPQIDMFWKVKNAINDYNIYTQNEIFKLLL